MQSLSAWYELLWWNGQLSRMSWRVLCGGVASHPTNSEQIVLRWGKRSRVNINYTAAVIQPNLHVHTVEGFIKCILISFSIYSMFCHIATTNLYFMYINGIVWDEGRMIIIIFFIFTKKTKSTFVFSPIESIFGTMCFFCNYSCMSFGICLQQHI